MLADKNRKLRQQLQQQYVARGRRAHDDILWAAPVFPNPEQNLAEAMREVAAMPQRSTEEGRQAF